MNYKQSAADIAAELGSDVERGLSIEKAHERIHSRGRNVISLPKAKQTFAGVRGRMLSLINMVLLLMAVIHVAADGADGIPLSVCFVAAAVVNAVVGYISFKRESSAGAAAIAAQNQTVRVIRDGKECSALATLLAQGDVCLLEKGQTVPADAKIIDCEALVVDESIINGEGSSVTKSPRYGIDDESVTALYMGTKIIEGSARAIVTDVGSRTQLGAVIELIGHSGGKSSAFAKRISAVGNLCGAAAAVMWALALVCRFVRGYGVASAFENSVTAAITAVPISMSAVLLVTMSLDIFRLKKRGVDVGSTSALEAMGASTVLCSGKRGFLTELNFSVGALRAGNGFDERTLRRLAAMCTTVELGGGRPQGDVMQVALVEDALKNGLSEEDIRGSVPLERVLDERSAKRLMTTVHRSGNGYVAVCKGSADAVLSHCSCVYDNGIRLLDTNKDIASIVGESQTMAAEALTVIGVAYKEMNDLASDPESGLIFVGLIGLRNPVRKDTPAAIKGLGSMGVRLCVITNDNLTSARALAEECGIDRENVLSGPSEAETESLVSRRRSVIFADTPPSMKAAIVGGINSHRENVLAAGRSSKDIDAMSSGEVSVTTDSSAKVCVSASDIHVSGSGLGKIAAAIRETRRSFINDWRMICFLLSCNAAEMVCAATALFMGYSTPFTAQGIVWLNAVIATLGAVAIWREPYHRGRAAKSRKLRSLRKGSIAPSVLLGAAVRGLLMGGGAMLFYIAAESSLSVADRRSAVFITLCAAFTFMAQSCRSDEPMIKGLSKNVPAFVCFALAALITALSAFLPGLSASHGFIRAAAVAPALAAGFAPALITELYKIFNSKKRYAHARKK